MLLHNIIIYQVTEGTNSCMQEVSTYQLIKDKIIFEKCFSNYEIQQLGKETVSRPFSGELQ
jgi:hypothetical protein